VLEGLRGESSIAGIGTRDYRRVQLDRVEQAEYRLH